MRSSALPQAGLPSSPLGWQHMLPVNSTVCWPCADCTAFPRRPHSPAFRSSGSAPPRRGSSSQWTEALCEPRVLPPQLSGCPLSHAGAKQLLLSCVVLPPGPSVTVLSKGLSSSAAGHSQLGGWGPTALSPGRCTLIPEWRRFPGLFKPGDDGRISLAGRCWMSPGWREAPP